MFYIKNCTTVYNYTLKLPWFNSSHFDEEQMQNLKKSMYVTILKRCKTVDKQVKYIAYGNKIFTFFKINEFDQFYKKKIVAYLVPWTFEHW